MALVFFLRKFYIINILIKSELFFFNLKKIFMEYLK
jgi:hypothetical protein